MIKAIIFDMDGTMVNTEDLWNVVNHSLSKAYDVQFSDDVRVQMMGKKDSECLQVFKDYYNLNATVDELIQKRRSILLSDLSSVKTMPGLFQLLDLIEAQQLKKAIATSSFTEFTGKILDMFDLRRRFEVVITGDMVTYSKPNPEMFLKAAAELSVEPAQCLVLEDAQNGIEAADAAGMKSIALPHQHNQNHDFTKATRILPSMLEVDVELLKTL